MESTRELNRITKGGSDAGNKGRTIARFKDFITIGQEGLEALGAGDDETPTPESKRKQEDESASLFERMSSAELIELYQTDKPRWQQVIDSLQSAGERKLAKLNGR